MRSVRFAAAALTALWLAAVGLAVPGLGLRQGRTVAIRLAPRPPWCVRAACAWEVNGRRLPAGTYRLDATAGAVFLQRAGTHSFAMSAPSLQTWPDAGCLRLDGRRYRGSLTFRPDAVVNTVTLPQYLYGVVAREMGGGAELEALKAQAVVARTYALAHMRGGAFGDGTSFQVYAGADGETAAARLAVDETRGEVLTWKGRLARFVCYCSTCGGHTAANEEAFMTPPIPYLRGVACGEAADGAPPSVAEALIPMVAPTPVDAPTPTDGPAPPPAPGGVPPANPHDFCSASPHYRWTVTWPPGVDADARILQRAPDGRVIRLRVGGHEYLGDVIRRALRFRAAGGREMNLYSTIFDLSVADGRLVARGAGFGHGVGLCQWGARGMAREGWSCARILDHYFPGTELSRAAF